MQNRDFSTKGIYVVTGLTNLSSHGLVYRISHIDKKDVWIKLNVTEGDNHHQGYPFVLIAKIANIGK